ncbi:MAG: folylpolyglutamate synthase/dihydrofolate synthase family protein [bacterium]
MNPVDDAYREVLDDLFRLRRFGVKLDILGPERALRRMGHPTRGIPVIQIAGTNGKGSVAAMAEAILRWDGRRTGLYTSPHLCRFTERIRVAGMEIGRAEVVSHYRRIRWEAPELTFFEVATALAALAFAEHGVELAVVEVGLGGRLDATNVFEPAVTGIAPVSREHTAYLGQDLDRIAWEKGSLMRPGVPVATTAEDPVVLAVLRRLAAVKNTPLAELGQDFRAVAKGEPELLRLAYEGPGGALEVLPPPLLGRHQVENAALALALVGLLPSGLRPSEEARREGLADVQWPGRMELLPGPPRTLLDAGHNPQAVTTLLEGLASVKRHRTLLVVAAMQDKDLSDMLPRLVDAVDETFLTRVQYYRGATPRQLLEQVPRALRDRVTCCEDVPAALDEAGRRAGPDDLIVVAGSVFLVGEARTHLLGELTDPVKVTDPVATR